MPDLKLTALLIATLLLLQGVCWLLARGLGMRLGRGAMIGGILLPFVLLAPWLSGARLLVPSDILRDPTIPGAPWIAPPYDSHDLLNDAVYQFLPWELEVRHALSERRLPLWSDTLEGGSSPWTNPQAAVLSPIALAARVFPIQHFLLGALALKILVAFEGAWLLARRVGRSRAASLLAAAGFAIGGGVIAWGLFPHTAAGAWVPWLAAGTIGLFRHPRPRTVATTAVLCAALLLSGHPETAAIGGLFAALCGLALRRKRTGFAKGFAAATAAALLGVALAAPHVLPFLHILPGSQRAHETLALERPSHRVSLQPDTWFEPDYGGIVLAPWSPHAYGRPFRDPYHGPLNWAETVGGYTGLLALAGACIALLAVRDRRSWPFLAFAIGGVLLAAHFLPLAYLTHAVPALRVPAYPRFLLETSLALSLAGAFGIDALLRRSGAGRRGWQIGAFLAAGAASLAVAADAWTVALWVLLAGAALLAVRWPRWGVVALGAVLLLDLVPWSRSLLPRGHPHLFYPRSAFLDRVIQEAGAPGGPWRATGADRLLYPSLLPVYGVAELRPHNPLVPMASVRVLDAAFGFHPTRENYFARLDPASPLLRFLNVRVLVTTQYEPARRILDARLERIDQGRFLPFRIYRDPAALPRWFLPASAEAIDPAGLDAWIAGLREPARVALWKEEIGDWLPPARPAAVPARAVSSTPGRVVLEVPGEGERLLATSVPALPGWRARSGGQDLPLVTVNGAYLGARVPAGAGEVELRFVPRGLVAGAILGGLAALILVLLTCRRPTLSRTPARE